MSIPLVVAGSIAQRSMHGGHIWVFLQYLLGMKQLGYEPLLIDHLTVEMSVGDGGKHSKAAWDQNIRRAKTALAQAGLDDSYCLLLGDGQDTIGMPRAEAIERIRQSPFLLNVMGFLRDSEMLASAARRVFLDIDPGFGQMWAELGAANVFEGHDDFVTIAENIDQRRCDIPPCGRQWIVTRPPVVLEEWPIATGGSHFTGVMTWRGPYAPIEFGGRRYGLRVHEFRRFAPLPQRTGEHFRIALDIDPAEIRDRQLLSESGWEILDPREVAGDPVSYRHFIQRSAAEFMVAKQMYVETGSGWFSDRSACYLASGKPVLAQDTGFSRNYPVGRGLLSFRDLDEAVDGMREIRGNYPQHAQAAREIAEEHFDARKVLARLLAGLGVG